MRKVDWMSCYFGTEDAQRLQRKSDALMPWMMQTPGACATGRLIASDDFRTLGWPIISQHLQEDGMFAFRWTTPEDIAYLRLKLKDTGATLFEWNGFMAKTSELQTRLSGRLARTLPDGFEEGPATGEDLNTMQSFLATQGISPLSTDMLSGVCCPALSTVIKDKSGAIMAAGFVGMLQNQFSKLADCAWMGLIAVDLGCRGSGLGSRITARLCQAAQDDLGASRVIAFAAPDNDSSIAMLTSAGLTPHAEKSCVAVLSGDRPTR